MPLWLYIALIVLAAYVVVSVLLYYLQDYFLFKPEKLPKDFSFYYENQQVSEYNLETRDGAIINGLHFSVEKPLGVVLYLKGNSKSIKGWGKFAVDFTRNNYDVIMVDYRGFGKSTGKRSQKAIKHDLQFIYNKIREKVNEKYIIIYGRSMGSGFATKLASMNSPKMLILDAPYYSLTKVTGRYMPFMPLSIILKYPMPTYKWIKYVKCPIHIIHGTKDKLIPFSSSVKLSQINAKLTRLHPIIEGGHKNLNNFESYHRVLTEILKSKEKKIDFSTTSIGVKHSAKR
ncbi:lysophospholipase [Aequorivita sublithincola DSM 14238]|uniref:Lysophospholipase n=1 Tax=Aequorivita sublithincola (strain DSM 14238 / LMG 21431 / ACAM 643 / 9-3) TaxID=746697 RepID=I3YZ08_AEQSU|nr:alpha/beta fold hydrolase [Aequorivita sublithincola]AFL82226.1 lysophospholipase [Aequorivita sublithincola DSM 14238]